MSNLDAKKLCLFIEDDVNLRGCLQEWMEHREDINPVYATDYVGAVEQLEEAARAGRPIDWVVSDYQYSGEKDKGRPNKTGSGGADLVRYLQTNMPLIPIVLVSGMGSAWVRQDLSERKLTVSDAHVFDKPANIDHVLDFLTTNYTPKASTALAGRLLLDPKPLE